MNLLRLVFKAEPLIKSCTTCIEHVWNFIRYKLFRLPMKELFK